VPRCGRDAAKARYLRRRRAARFIGDEAPALWVHHAGYALNYGSPDYDLAIAAAVNIAPLRPLYASLAAKLRVIVTARR